MPKRKHGEVVADTSTLTSNVTAASSRPLRAATKKTSKSTRSCEQCEGVKCILPPRGSEDPRCTRCTRNNWPCSEGLIQGVKYSTEHWAWRLQVPCPEGHIALRRQEDDLINVDRLGEIAGKKRVKLTDAQKRPLYRSYTLDPWGSEYEGSYITIENAKSLAIDWKIYDRVKSLFELAPPETESGDEPEQSTRQQPPAKRQRRETRRKDSFFSTPKNFPEQEFEQGMYSLPKSSDDEFTNSGVMDGRRPARAAHVRPSTASRVMSDMGSSHISKEPRHEDRDRVGSSPPYRDYSRVPSPSFSIDDDSSGTARTPETYDLSKPSPTPIPPATPAGLAVFNKLTSPQSAATAHVSRTTRTATGSLPLRGTQIQLAAERMKLITLETQIKRFEHVGKQNKALRTTNENLKPHIATSARHTGKSLRAARQEAEDVEKISMLELDNLGLRSAVGVRDTRILELEATINELRGELGLGPTESSFGPEEEDEMLWEEDDM